MVWTRTRHIWDEVEAVEGNGEDGDCLFEAANLIREQEESADFMSILRRSCIGNSKGQHTMAMAVSQITVFRGWSR